MFQQPLTLRRIAPVDIPSFAPPRASAALFSFGGTVHSRIASRSSIRSNQGASDTAERSARPRRSRQYASVGAGVRKLDVQFTVVDPPTQRPWRMVIALSSVFRAADSW